MRAHRLTQTADVVIVGAGPAGIGMGIVLQELDVGQVIILERDRVGATFHRWPKEMRFISPSFMSNSFGLLDLNSVALGTSPGFSLGTEHPSGKQYASYLRALAKHFRLPIQTGIDVMSMAPNLKREGFTLETSDGPIRSRIVVWAGGEFQYPNLHPFPGSEHCLHSSQVRSWRQWKGRTATIIGGAESGVDTAFHLAKCGVCVRLLDGNEAWNSDEPDPSRSLSPYTLARLGMLVEAEKIELVGNAHVTRVDKETDNWAIHSSDGRSWNSTTAPILATGYLGSPRLIAPLFEWGDEGNVLLTDHDESTINPGLFLVGPQVRHQDVIFCFIYKFRQRFAVVAQAIGNQLGIDTSPLNVFRESNMFLEDLSCCSEECQC